MTKSKLISLAEAARRFRWDGMQYASGAALPVGSDAVMFGREIAAPTAAELANQRHVDQTGALRKQ